MTNGDFKPQLSLWEHASRAPLGCAQRVPIAPSRRLLRWLLAGHLGVACALLFELGHQPGGWLLAALLCLHPPLLAREWRRAARPYRAAWLDPDGTWWLETHSGTLQEAHPGSTRFIGAGCLLLPLRLGRWRAGPTLCLMRDNLGEDDFRRLRVRLLWGGAA